MEIIKSTADIRPYTSKSFNDYFGGLSTPVIDIETDGLNPSYSKIILGGLLIPPGGGADITQFFADNINDEEELLISYANVLTSGDILISYNGERFDLPFINQRMMKYKLNIDIDDLQSFDLYKIINRYSNLREFLPNLRQKSIEHFLGLSPLRDDEISGAESVDLYRHFLKTGSQDARSKILLHNRDDLVQLASIIRVLDKLDLHFIAFHEGFIVPSRNKRIIIKKISFGKKSLDIVGRTKNLQLDYYSFDGAYQAIHRAKEKEFVLNIPYERKHGALFIDLEAFGLDFSILESYPAYESGYLILKEKDKINCAEINKTIKTILSEILNKRMV